MPFDTSNEVFCCGKLNAKQKKYLSKLRFEEENDNGKGQETLFFSISSSLNSTSMRTVFLLK